MYDPYIVRRTQIYLDQSQSDRLAKRAITAGTSSSKLIREAVESYLAAPDDEIVELLRQQKALADAFGSIPRLPEGAKLVEDLRRADEERGAALEDQWRSR